jgi:hypothetical protein
MRLTKPFCDLLSKQPTTANTFQTSFRSVVATTFWSMIPTGRFFLSIYKELSNSELYEFIINDISGAISVANVVRRLKLLGQTEGNRDSELDFIAAHFCELSSSDLSKLDFDELAEILQRPALKIESEDWLFDFIRRRIALSSCHFELLSQVRLEYLSLNSFYEYFELVSNSFEHFTLSHWNSLRSRLILPVEPKCPNNRLRDRSLSFQPLTPLLGIIAYLTAKFSGNIHDCGVANITADRPYSGDPGYAHAPKNAADLGSGSYFHSANEPNQSVTFDFKALRVRPTHCSIRTYNSSPNAAHLKSWVLDGSDDGTTWMEVDRRENNSDLNNKFAVKTFTVERVETFRMVRLRQIAPNHANNNYLLITAFEIFGALIGLV